MENPDQQHFRCDTIISDSRENKIALLGELYRVRARRHRKRIYIMTWEAYYTYTAQPGPTGEMPNFVRTIVKLIQIY